MKKIICTVFIVLYASGLSFTQDIEFIAIKDLSVRIIVDVESLYTPTGIYLEVGDSVLIFAEGMACPHMNFEWYGPEGVCYQNSPSNFPVPDFPVFSLMGKVGENGTPFYIGSSYGFSTNISGEFFLGVNDYPLTDNNGYWIAWIIPISESGSTTLIREKNLNEYTVSVFPNPTENIINVTVDNLDNYVCQLYDVNGKQILIKESDNNNTVLELSPFTKGTYFLNILNENQLISSNKIVLE